MLAQKKNKREMTLNTGYLPTFLFSKMEMIIKLFMQSCLHLYGTRRRVALVIFACNEADRVSEARNPKNPISGIRVIVLDSFHIILGGHLEIEHGGKEYYYNRF